ncbi:MAG: pyridoxamine 5'-phosphate oxidase [Candidatus Puniceispirillaceae bacterium]
MTNTDSAKDAHQSPLHMDRLEADPFTLFSQWMAEAKTAEINDPDAMALASVNADGMPSVRMVLLREVTPQGFIFFTNYNSRKSGELLATGKAAGVFHWKSLRRQIRITGHVTKASDAQSDAYFNSRARGSRIGAWASQQSEPLAKRADLAASVAHYENLYPDDNVPRPPHWGGFIIQPAEIEFWADGAYRLHDRFVFKKNDAGVWSATRLNP